MVDLAVLRDRLARRALAARVRASEAAEGDDVGALEKALFEAAVSTGMLEQINEIVR